MLIKVNKNIMSHIINNILNLVNSKSNNYFAKTYNIANNKRYLDIIKVFESLINNKSL